MAVKQVCFIPLVAVFAYVLALDIANAEKMVLEKPKLVCPRNKWRP